MSTELVSPPTVPTQQLQQQQNSATGRNSFRGNNRGNKRGNRGRGCGRGWRGQSSFRQYGETDPFGVSIAPLNIYENQVIPIEKF